MSLPRWDGSAQVLPHEHHVTLTVTVPAEEEALAAPEVRHVAGGGEDTTCLAAAQGLSGGLRRARRAGWRRRHGDHRHAVRSHLCAQHLVPHQPDRGKPLRTHAMPSNEALMQFHPMWLLFALALHLTMCTLVGLLYGAMLPMLPGKPILLGGVIAPLTLDRAGLFRTRLRQSAARPEDQLVLVRGLASSVRCRGGSGRRPPQQAVDKRKTCPSRCAPASKPPAS